MRYHPDGKALLWVFLLLNSLPTSAQSPTPTSPLDSRNLGVVLDHPDMDRVRFKSDVPYLSDAQGTLKLDIYQPPGLKVGEKRSVVVFMNALGDAPGEQKIKNWGIYQSWPRLVAAHGFVGVSMEADRNRIQESLQGVFDFLGRHGTDYGIDADRMGVYAASANVTEASRYLMGASAHRGIRAAALYYGRSLEGPFRNDLPVLFIVAEGDLARSPYGTLWNEVLKNNAPWTLLMASGQPHAFDAFSSNDESRRIVRQTISFWKDRLEPVPAFSDQHPLARQIVEARYAQNPVRAAELLKDWTAQHPADATGLSMYGAALRDLKRYDEAEPVFGKLLALQPKNGEALTGLAVLAYLKNRIPEAEAYVTRAAEAGGANRTLYATLGFRLLALGKFGESIPHYLKATQLEPFGVDFYNLACAYALTNEKEKALSALERAAKLGYGSKQHYDSDPDLASVRTEERYKKLFTELH